MSEANAATPEANAPATPVENKEEQVTLTKAQHEQLQRDAARAAANQSKADRYDREQKKATHFNKQQKAAAPADDAEEAIRAEERKAERGIMAIAADPAYREILDADPTLRDLMTKNPLAALPLLAEDPLDADDALELIKASLEKRRPAPAAPKQEDKPAPVIPNSGVNAKTSEPSEDYETAKKNPNTEKAIAGMVMASIKSRK